MSPEGNGQPAGLRRVLLVVRSDGRSKHGGDTVQADRYAAALTALGATVEIVPFRAGMELPEDSLPHFLNVDRPYEFLHFVRRWGRRFLVSPIHHAAEDVRRMRSADRASGPRALLGALPEPIRELLLYSRRTALLDRSRAGDRVWALAQGLIDLIGLRSRVRTALDEAYRVLLLSEQESAALRQDLAWSGRNGRLVPNGLAASAAPGLAWAHRPSQVLVVGRIEPRKRQLELLDAAERKGIALTFVGAVNQNAAAYGARFVGRLKGSRSTWTGSLPHERVSELMRCARVLLNGSWAEVQSLVDLEAAAAGCWVVASATGSSFAHLGAGAVVQVPVRRLDIAVEQAARLAGPGAPEPRTPFGWTWEDVARRLLEQYVAAGLLVPERVR